MAPVFSADGDVEYYLPQGRWTNWFTHEVVEGGGWRREVHGFDTLPLWMRGGAAIPLEPLERLDLRIERDPDASNTRATPELG